MVNFDLYNILFNDIIKIITVVHNTSITKFKYT